MDLDWEVNSSPEIREFSCSAAAPWAATPAAIANNTPTVIRSGLIGAIAPWSDDAAIGAPVPSLTIKDRRQARSTAGVQILRFG
jgi:hypothetical protein